MKRESLAAGVITAALAAASALGLTEALGAHPFWAVKTGVIGSVLGLLAYGGLRWAGLRPGRIALLGVLALILGAAAAIQGKSIFAASFAENALAGRFWFFGWFALMAGLCLTLCALAASAMRR